MLTILYLDISLLKQLILIDDGFRDTAEGLKSGPL